MSERPTPNQRKILQRMSAGEVLFYDAGRAATAFYGIGNDRIATTTVHSLELHKWVQVSSKLPGTRKTVFVLTPTGRGITGKERP